MDETDSKEKRVLHEQHKIDHRHVPIEKRHLARESLIERAQRLGQGVCQAAKVYELPRPAVGGSHEADGRGRGHPKKGVAHYSKGSVERGEGFDRPEVQN